MYKYQNARVYPQHQSHLQRYVVESTVSITLSASMPVVGTFTRKLHTYLIYIYAHCKLVCSGFLYTCKTDMLSLYLESLRYNGNIMLQI